jgi:hypothetical protein
MADLVYLLDNARFLSATEGTGAYVQGATPTGYLDPASAGAISGRTYTWRAESEDSATWELFYGKWTAGGPPNVSRDTIILNSSGGTSAINWPTGVRRVTCVAVAEEIALRGYADGAPYRQQPLVPVSWDGNIAVVALGNFVSVGIPAGTRSLLVTGRARCMGSGGSAVRDIAMSAGLRNSTDTADASTFDIAYAAMVPGQYVNAVVHGLLDLGAPLAESRVLTFRAQSSTGEAVQLYSLRATVECIKG